MLTTGSVYLFFCTGHFCEFAGLQYTAGVSLACGFKTRPDLQMAAGMHG